MARNTPIEPDKGWAWIILLCAFMGNVFLGGIIYSFGVFYLEFLDYFQGGKGATAWIGSVICAVYALISPLVSVLVKKFGCRVVTILGALLVSGGFVLCRFSQSIWMMVITYGILGGTGFGFVYLTGYIMIGYYFHEKRPIALGIAACGSSIGGFIFAPMSSYLIKAYTWQGSMLVIAGIVLNDIVIGATYRTLPEPDNNEKMDTKNYKKKKLLNFYVLLQPGCTIMCLATFIHMLGFYVPFIYLPDFASEVGLNKQQGAFLLSIIGITNTIGRALAGIISNISFGDPVKLNNAALITGGGITLVLPWLDSYILLCVYAMVFGTCFGVVMSLSTIILVEFMGKENLGDSFGFLNAACGTATLIGTPLTGVLYDSTGSYVIAFISAGSVILLAGIVCLPIRAIHKCVTKDFKEEDLVMETCLSSLPPENTLNVMKKQQLIYGSNHSLTMP